MKCVRGGCPLHAGRGGGILNLGLLQRRSFAPARALLTSTRPSGNRILMYALGECLLHFSVSSASVISGCERARMKNGSAQWTCAPPIVPCLFFVSQFAAQKGRKLDRAPKKMPKMIQLVINLTLDHIAVPNNTRLQLNLLKILKNLLKF